MFSPLAAIRGWVDQIHVNVTSQGVRAGHPAWIKRRRVVGRFAMGVANVFFRLARNPVEALAEPAEWAAWEVAWFQRLHGPEFSAGAEHDGSVWAHMLPGESLASRLAAGTLQPQHLVSAGVELRRAHAVECDYHGGRWSHGDCHTGNFIHDDATGRARLVDFEVRHHRGMPEHERHADDLLVLLQDVCGRCPPDAWLPLAESFLTAYGRSEILARLPERLRVPHGIPRLWWAVRTTWMPRAELERRMAALAESLRNHPGCGKSNGGSQPVPNERGRTVVP